MTLAHVCTPEEVGVTQIKVIVISHRLVGAECFHESGHGARHAETSVRIDAVAADSGLHEFGSDVTLMYGPLSRTKHADRLGAALLDHLLHLCSNLVEGLVP